MNRQTRAAVAAAVLMLSGGVILASILIGAETVSLRQVWIEWRSGRPLSETPALSILVNQRLPRTLAALLAGAGLTLAGCAFQALLRNPLATPYTLGVASAGAFGAWVATVVFEGAGLSLLGFSAVQVFAFAFAAIDIFIIYTLASRRRRFSAAVLLLTGVTLGMLSNAGILLMRYLALPNQLIMMDRWLMGGVDILGYKPVATLVAGVVPCALILVLQAPKFDQIGFSPEIAAGRGVNVKRLQLVTFFVGSLMTAIIVSKVGPIGFVGLIVPHSVRAVTGSRHRILMPVSLFAGGGFLCFCDIIARKLLPGETPIGIITALIGGPFFLYLLMRRRFGDWQV